MWLAATKPAWAPAEHCRFPPAFQQAARTLLLAAYRASAGAPASPPPSTAACSAAPSRPYALTVEGALQRLKLDHALVYMGLPPLRAVRAALEIRPAETAPWRAAKQPPPQQQDQGQEAAEVSNPAGLGSLPPELIHRILELAAYPHLSLGGSRQAVGETHRD